MGGAVGAAIGLWDPKSFVLPGQSRDVKPQPLFEGLVAVFSNLTQQRHVLDRGHLFPSSYVGMTVPLSAENFMVSKSCCSAKFDFFMNSDLSGGKRHLPFEQPGLDR